MAQVTASVSNRKERRSMQICNVQPVFHCLAEEWQDFEELKPKAKDKWTFVTESRSENASYGVVCGGKHISLHEMWKKQQKDK